MKTATHKTVCRCEHCGLEIDDPAPEDCPRCDRTFFVGRRVMTDEYADQLLREDRKAAAVAVERRRHLRRSVAKQAREILSTGRYGALTYQSPTQRREAARQLIARFF